MKRAKLRIFALGTVFTASLMGCAGEEAGRARMQSNALVPAGQGLPANLEEALVKAQMERRDGNLAAAAQSVSPVMPVAPGGPYVLGGDGKILGSEGGRRG